MLLSVIIPTYKRPDALRICLESLAPGVQTIAPELFEVIVTDDDLEGDTREFISRDFPWAHYNAGPRKGPASNRNSGAKSARGDWLIFLDDDCVPQKDFLTGYAEAVEKYPDISVFEGSTLAERPQQRLDEEAPINNRGGYLWSCNFLINRQVFFEIGGFCELYPHACMEDVDFREQLKTHDKAFIFIPEAGVVHPWRSLSPDDRFLKMRLLSHAIFYNRYPTQKPSLVLTLRIILRLWILFIFVDAPRLKFRGFGRYFARQKAMTQLHYQNWSGVGETFQS